MKKLKRTPMLRMADVSDQLFRTLNRREQVPNGRFPNRQRQGETQSSWEKRREASNAKREQRGYSIVDALYLALANAYTTRCSLSRDAARELVLNYEYMDWEFLQSALEGKGAWITHFDISGQGPMSAYGITGTTSPLPVFSESATDLQALLSQIENKSIKNGGVPTNILIFNFSQFLREFRDRALKVDPEIEEDFQEWLVWQRGDYQEIEKFLTIKSKKL